MHNDKDFSNSPKNDLFVSVSLRFSWCKLHFAQFRFFVFVSFVLSVYDSILSHFLGKSIDNDATFL